MMFELLPVWLLGLAVALGLVTIAWGISLVLRDASVIDSFWGGGFVLLAWFYFFAVDGPLAPKLSAAALVTMWGGRLTVHILRRSHGQPEDYRYRAMREKHGSRFPVVSLFTVFLLQGALLWMISTPLLLAQRADAIGAWHFAALLLFAIGFLFEAVGDAQLEHFKADSSNRGKVLSTGLWRYTRHPNYFGDAVVWWSFFLLALAAPGGLWTIASPLLMTFFLVKVSGVSLLEKKLQQKPGYREYVSRTNAFFPWFPRSGEVPR